MLLSQHKFSWFLLYEYVFSVCNLDLFEITDWKPIKRGAVWFNSCYSKTIHDKVVSFLNLYTKRSNQKAQQFWRVVNSWKHLKKIKECFGIEARGPQKREARAFARFAQWLIRLWPQARSMNNTHPS